MEDIIIRKIKKSDIPSAAEIQVNGWKTAYKGIVDSNFLDALSKEEKIKKMENVYTKIGFVIAEIKGEVVGFCKYIDNNSYSPEIVKADCELIALYVKPELKYKGIGTKLVKYVKEEFREKGKRKMIIWCLKENKPSRKFYEKMGGTKIKEKPIIIGEKQYQEVCYEYDI